MGNRILLKEEKKHSDLLSQKFPAFPASQPASGDGPVSQEGKELQMCAQGGRPPFCSQSKAPRTPRRRPGLRLYPV